MASTGNDQDDQGMAERALRGFSGAVADQYAQHRRGYPPPVVDAIVDAFGLAASDLAIDLGCGTGQLTLPLAERVRAVIGIDPEPDMLRLAAGTANERQIRPITWVLGFDSDLPAVGALLEPESVAVITIATAIQWMDHIALFADAKPLLRDGGGVAIVTNGTPLWLQDTEWSRTTRAVLEEWTGREAGSSCGTDANSRTLYKSALESAGFRTRETVVEYEAPLDTPTIVGGLLSAMPRTDVDDEERRAEFTRRMHKALGTDARFDEQVRVVIQTGTFRR